MAQVTPQPVRSRAGTPNLQLFNAARETGPGAAARAAALAARRELSPQGAGARAARAGPASAPAPSPACPPARGTHFSISSAATFRFSYSLSLRARTMLGVSGAKSFSGFMVATRGAPRSPATPQPARLPGLRRGPGESAAPRCLRRWLMGHAAPARLPRSAARADSEPGPGPRPRNTCPRRLTRPAPVRHLPRSKGSGHVTPLT